MKNQTKYTIFFIPLTLFFLNGCEKKKNQETFHTINYYMKNTEARDKRVQECKELEEQTEISARDCANAYEAVPKKLPTW